MKVLLIGGSRSTVSFFKSQSYQNFDLEVLTNFKEIIAHQPSFDYDYIFCDYESFRVLPYDENEFNIRSINLGYNRSKTRLTLLIEKGDLEEAALYLKSGDYSYISYPLTQTEIFFHLNRPMGMESTNDSNRPDSVNWKPDEVVMMRTNNTKMQVLYDQMGRVASKNSTILLTGETGTGKSLLARQIHAMSPRSSKPFISIHCGAIAETLLESELFGHEKGAFTGADKQKKGKFELAHGGTIFLDEVGTISQAMQIKLLRVLQDRSLERVGGEKSINVDVRVITATNENLMTLVEAKTFRLDLFYRLNVFPLHIPALRDRIEDLPLLCSSLISKLNALHGGQITGLGEITIEILKNYQWPGNIRELENLLERAFILETSNVLTASSFPAEMLSGVATSSAELPGLGEGTLADVRRKVIDKIEEEYLRTVLAAEKGRIQNSATIAGITTRQFHKLMTRYKIDKSVYK